MVAIVVALLAGQTDPKVERMPAKATVGRVTVSVPFAAVSKLRYEPPGRGLGQIVKTDKELLAILLEITVADGDKPVKYLGWNGNVKDETRHATLADDEGKEVFIVDVPTVAYPSRISNGIVLTRPQSRLWYQPELPVLIEVKMHDVLVFQPFSPRAKSLTLTLPRKAVGVESDFVIKLDPSLFAVGELDAVRDPKWYLDEWKNPKKKR